MSNRDLPMMPWFPQDFAGATSAWTFVERALYRALLDAQWVLGKLPTDEKRLARIAGIDETAFAECWPIVSEKFVLVGDCFQNERLEEHRATAERLREQRANAAKASVLARAKRSSNGRSTARSTAVEHPSPSPSEDCIERETRAGASELSVKAKVDEIEHQIGFERIRKAYPAFSGRVNWIIAEHNARVLIEQGSSWNDLLEGVKRYAKYVDSGGVSSTGHVLHPENFFNAPDKPWMQAWPPPVAKPRAVAVAEKFVPPPDEDARAHA